MHELGLQGQVRQQQFGVSEQAEMLDSGEDFRHPGKAHPVVLAVPYLSPFARHQRTNRHLRKRFARIVIRWNKAERLANEG